MNAGEAGPARGRAWAGVLLVLGVCAAVYWSWLGVAGLQGTEGHRVIPGWEMLERGEWLRVTMFEQTYLRKPPGMPWAIGASAAALGESAFSARAVSAAAATTSALVAMAFGARWFGRRWGVYAGLVQALTPLFWQPGRTADIEALHNLGVQVAALAMVDALVRRESAGLGRQVRLGLLAACGIVLAVLTKGPAGAPAALGVVVGTLVVMHAWRALARPAVGVAIVIAAGVLAPLALAVLRANADAAAVREDVGGFLWSWATLGKTAVLPVAALLAAMPASVWALFPFGPDAHREAQAGGDGAVERLGIARALAWSWVGSVLVCVLAGMSNPRYAMPGAMLLAPLASYGANAFASGMTPSRRMLARVACFGHPAVLGAVLLGAGVTLAARESHWDPDRTGGPDAGAAIAAALPVGPEPIQAWADGLVEARPDALLYARQIARERGVQVRPLWRKSAVRAGELPPPGSVLVLRTDSGGDERPLYAQAISAGVLTARGSGRVHRYEFTVFAVNERPLTR
jgi:hypothetical protein